MSTRRSYQDACAASHALDLVGERWALLVVRELLLGPKRFTDLRSGLPGISANVLTQRLVELEAAGVVRRRKLPPPAAAWIYELTEWGLDLEPILMALGRWAVRSPGLHRGVPMGIDGAVLSLRAMFCPLASRDVTCRVELRLGEDCFTADVAGGVLDVHRGEATQPDATVTTDPNTLVGMLYRGLDPANAKVEGDPVAFRRFLTLFPGPAR